MRVKLSNGDIVEINGEVVEEERTEENTEEITEERTEETTEENSEKTPTTAEILATIKKLESRVDSELDKIKNDFIAKITANPKEKKVDETEQITVDDLADLY